MIDFLFSAFGCMVILAFWIGAWYWFITRKDSSQPRKGLSRPDDSDAFSSDAM